MTNKHTLLLYLAMVLLATRACESLLHSCPGDWKPHGRFCYKFVTEPTLNFSDADQFCQDMFSTLAVPQSAGENGFFASLFVKDSIFLGVHLDIGKTVREFLNTTDDGEYHNWDLAKFGSFNATAKKRCTKFNTAGLWRVSVCNATRKFICKSELARCSQTARCFSASGDQSRHPCLLNHTYEEWKYRSPMHCCLACSSDSRCRSFNLMGDVCHLNDVTASEILEYDSHSADEIDGCMYYEHE